MTEKAMNLRGLKCPLPALRVKKALTGLKSGDLIVAECTDPLAAFKNGRQTMAWSLPQLMRPGADA